jgi:transposase
MERRQPLAPINPNRAYKKELSATQRCQIITYRTIGLSNEQIGARTFCTPATVATTLRRNPLRDDYKTLSRLGRPQALSRRGRRIILRIIRANPRVTYNVIKLEASVAVSTSTLSRMLKEEGITNWLAKKRPLLKPEHVAKRLKFCKEHVNWTWDEWRLIIWSDECSLERGAGARPVWVFRTPEQK